MHLTQLIVLAVSATAMNVGSLSEWSKTPDGHPNNCLHQENVGYDTPYRQYTKNTANFVQVPYAAAEQYYSRYVNGSSVASPPSWTEPFATLSTGTYSFLAESGYGINGEGLLAPFVRRDYFAVAFHEWGTETWQLKEGETVLQTEVRNRDWYSNGAVAFFDARL